MEFVKTVGPLGMIFIMFSLGLNLSYKDFFEVLKKPRNLIIALICQMIMLPLIGIIIISFFPMQAEFQLGVFLLLILPSDHKIKNIEVFLKSIIKAKLSAREGNIVTFGIKPNKPATGYGYIKADKDFREDIINPFKIKKFIEKPNRQLAEELLKDKSYSWNSGIFIAKASVLIKEMEKFSPEIFTLCKQAIKDNINDLDFKRLNKS